VTIVAEASRILSISRRTDIPAFYTEWFVNRVQAGFCHWMNPFGGQVYRVSLRPEDCLALVFWTRNVRPLLPHVRELHERGFRFYFHYTVTGYPRGIDAYSPPQRAAVAAARRLAEEIGPDLVMWRYDPVVFSSATPAGYHLERFEALAAGLKGATHRCYVSFLDLYGKTERNLRRLKDRAGLELRRPDPQEQHELLARFVEIAHTNDMTVHVCCDRAPADLRVEQAHCIDPGIIRSLRPDMATPLRAVPSRPGCGCIHAVDIGAYDTCTFGCVYCYATNSRETALSLKRRHDSNDTILWRPDTLRGVDLSTVEQRLKGPGEKSQEGAAGAKGATSAKGAKGATRAKGAKGAGLPTLLDGFGDGGGA
jgi:hypothetical protein